MAITELGIGSRNFATVTLGGVAGGPHRPPRLLWCRLCSELVAVDELAGCVWVAVGELAGKGVKLAVGELAGKGDLQLVSLHANIFVCFMYL